MKRLAFVLASIHTGSALSLMPAVIRYATRLDLSLFIFPGGRLDSRPDREYLRNAIYRLANTENLDGLVSWGSSIGGAVPVSELNDFHRSFEPLPYVTIAHKMEGHPCVAFDAYGGMKALVLHFIRVHGARRLAFIRGPETHASSMERYRGFRDALLESGLRDPAETPLVSDPFPWGSGEDAIGQLFGERGLIPGRDFDSLICSSDMMAFAAVRALDRFGYRVPEHYRVGGFNDSQESRILSSPFTTVHLPYRELGTASVSLLLSLLEGNRATDVPPSDRTLPMLPVIRESCGCSAGESGEGGEVPIRQAVLTGQDGQAVSFPAGSPGASRLLGDSLSRLFSLDPEDREALIDPVLDAFFSLDLALSFRLLDQVLTRFFERDGDIALMWKAISLAFDSGLLPLEKGRARELEREAHYLSGKVQHRVAALRKYETGRRQAVLNSLKCDLLCARDRDSLVPVLAVHLPSIGMDSVAVILSESDEASRSLGWFCPEGLFPPSPTPFPAKRLLPAEAAPHFASGAYLVQPLFMENQPLGYIVHNVPFDDGTIYEELRSAIGSAIKGIFLFEETIQAKRAAEEAERARTDFFSRIGSDLVDPLESILSDIEALPDAGAAETGDFAARAPSLSRIRSALATHLERTKRYIDVTLSLTDELALERKLFYPGSIIGEAAGFPPLVGDGERIARAIAALREAFELPPRVSPGSEGLELSFFSATARPESLWSVGDLVFAERTVLLHGGQFTRGSRECAAVLPWPTLSGLPFERAKKGGRAALALRGGEPSFAKFRASGTGAGTFPVTVAWDERNSLPPETPVTLLWNAAGADIEDRLEVLSLRHSSEYFRSPFLYEGPPLEGESLLAALESAVNRGNRGPVLFVGLDPADFPGWYEPGESLSVPSADLLPSAVRNALPSLVVLPDSGGEALSLLRSLPGLARVPVAVLPQTIRSELEIDALCDQPLVILCNRGVASSPEVARRMRGIAAGKETLPPHTGALVKRAILYMNVHYASQIARWKLADSVNVSEDYLTRIFHREVGLSLWEYLNRYRIFLATELLLRTNLTINEIAYTTGFQDQAYFCRVFKKQHGIPPGKIRAKKSE